MTEDKSIVNISINNQNELNFKLDIDALLTVENLEAFYLVVGHLDRMKRCVLNLIEDIEVAEAEDQIDEDDENDIDTLLNMN